MQQLTPAIRQSIGERLGVLAFLFCSLNVDYEKEDPPSEEGDGSELEAGGAEGEMRREGGVLDEEGGHRSERREGGAEKEKRPQPVGGRELSQLQRFKRILLPFIMLIDRPTQ